MLIRLFLRFFETKSRKKECRVEVGVRVRVKVEGGGRVTVKKIR